MKAELIIIGDEILIGQIVDTNSSWICKQLEEIGIQVHQISTIGDEEKTILDALSLASSRSEIILMTGGLGPTKDDVTKKTLVRFFNSELVLDQAVLKHVEGIFQKYNKPMPLDNKSQAEVLAISEVLFNNAGTAPGMWIHSKDKYYVIMPGVPTEMKYLMSHEVLPRLKRTMGRTVRQQINILTAGLGESFLAEKIRPIEDRLPSYIHLAYLPSFGEVRLRLSAIGEDEARIGNELAAFSNEIKLCLEDYFINDTNESLQVSLIKIMREKGLTLSTAESCTGGLCSHLVTTVPGSSEVFLGGIISYSNEVKVNSLGVRQETLDEFGAVSEQTALEMVVGVQKEFNSDYSISITGIAGPGGGSPEKPIGTVWIAVKGTRNVVSRKFTFGFLREENMMKAAKNALIMLYRLIENENQIK